MLMQLLQTKLNVPVSHSHYGRTSHVNRQHLLQKLNSGFSKKLTMICAPAGFGKSTLLGQWIRQRGEQDGNGAGYTPPSVAWLSLDEGDNDPLRFWTYFVAALQSMDASIGIGTLAILQSPQPLSHEVLLTTLLNEVSARPQNLVLILDDYHVIGDQAIHKALLFLLDHLPTHFQLIVSSRSDPPWPIARWRSQGQLTELRTDDLRFTAQEAATFLKEVMGLVLSEANISALETRTEGWIAGLQLAALSLQGAGDREQFIALFSGSNRYIVDYLAEEVISQQPEDVQHFLLRTSILERMCGPLCDALLQNGENDSRAYRGQALLEKLEHANLFLIRLDDERTWYRYHHLFADVLRLRLRQSQPEMVAELHQRASSWYEEAGQIEAAVDHALAVPDVERAAVMIERVAMAIMLKRSEIAVARKLVERVPLSIIQARPHLTLAYGTALMLFGQFKEVEELFATAASLNSSALSAEIAGGLLTLHSTMARFRGDMPRALELAHQALQSLPTTDQPFTAAALMTLAVAHLRMGNIAAGQQALAETVAAAIASGVEYIALGALEELASSQARQGLLTQAKQTCEETLAQARRWGVERTPAIGLAHIVIGEILCEWNETEHAALELTHGIRLLRGTTEKNLVSRGYRALARTQLANGDTDGALLTLKQGDEWLIQMQIAASDAHAWLAAHRARIAIAKKDFAAALRWSKATHLAESDVLGHPQRLTLVRLYLAQSQRDSQPHILAEATQMLSDVMVAAEKTGWMSTVIECCVLQALVSQALSERAAAQDALTHALQLGQQENYIRLFVDEGEPVRLLLLEFKLAMVRKMPAAPEMFDYVDRVLAAFPAVAEITPTPESPKPSLVQNLVEPLTERELEILRMVSEGFSNREIADRLIVTVGTVKKHLNNIFGKLNVSSRTQALVSARVLNLL